jgi:hypothetical protein
MEQNTPVTPLKAHNWGIDPKQENPQLAIAITRIFVVSDALDIMVTNRVGGVPVDVWLILEVHRVTEDGFRRTLYSYVDNKRTQTEALIIARRYVFAIYRVDVVYDDLPF